MDITTHPFLNVLWTCFVIFIWIAWFFLLIKVLSDIFRRHDIGGGMKALWTIFVVFVPFLAVLIYLIAEGGKMADRDVKVVQAQQAQMDAYIRDTAGTGGAAAEIERAKKLLDSGAIDEAEYQRLKAAALA